MGSHSRADILGALLRIILKAYNQIIEGLVCQRATAKALGKMGVFPKPRGGQGHTETLDAL